MLDYPSHLMRYLGHKRAHHADAPELRFEKSYPFPTKSASSGREPLDSIDDFAEYTCCMANMSHFD